MAPETAPSSRADDRLATRVAKSPPLGVLGGILAILLMILALAGVVPRALFFLAAIVLVVIAYTLDKRFKATARPPVATPASQMVSTPATTTPTASASATETIGTVPPPTAAPAAEVDALPLLPVGDLQAEHARLTQELTDRVDDDEDVRFEKFMRLRKIEDELARQQAAPPA